MKKINEIFYSLQGEGYNAGKAAIFIRFAGCNIKCPFCDTNHQQGIQMSDAEIIERISEYPTRLVILTGGEPTLFADDFFIEELHKKGYTVAIETNGTNKVSEKIDFITLSPKFEFVKSATLKQIDCDELKVIFNSKNDMAAYNTINAKYKYIQPCDTDNKEINKKNIISSIEFVKKNPDWRLSLQIQKILKIQ